MKKLIAFLLCLTSLSAHAVIDDMVIHLTTETNVFTYAAGSTHTNWNGLGVTGAVTPGATAPTFTEAAGYSFDGVVGGDELTLPFNAVSNFLQDETVHSVSIWVKPGNTSQANRRFLSLKDSNSELVNGHQDAGTGSVKWGGRADAGDGFQSHILTNSITNAVWTHFVNVYNLVGDQLIGWVNGTAGQTSTVSWTGTFLNFTNFTVGTSLGAQVGSLNNFDGEIDDYRHYTHTMTGIDALTLFTNGRNNINVPTAKIVPTPTSIFAGEGTSTSMFSTVLAEAPLVTVTVHWERTSGDLDLTLASGGTQEFTTVNWANAQTAVVAAAEDAGGVNSQAIMTGSDPAAVYTPGVITVNEVDNDAGFGTGAVSRIYWIGP